jgi:hypothetical protein
VQDAFIEQLSNLLDGELAGSDRRALESHLAECAGCRQALDDLRQLRAAARELPPRQPARDLWPGIESRLDARSTRGVSFSWPAALAAGLFIAIMSGLATWVVLHTPADPPAVVATGRAPRGMQPRPVAVNSAPYDRAIADLLTTLRTERRDLNPRTVETIERSLAVINKAIADAQAALDADPTDAELVSYLSDRQRARLAVLRQVERFAPEAH